jgi:lysophospholipase L1-like esterase
VARPYAELLLHNDDAAYPDYAGRDLATRYPTLTLADHARGGATSAGVIEQAKLAPANPAGNTLVALSIGGNDLINNATALMSADQTRQIAQTVSANVAEALRVFADKARYPGEVFVVALNVYEMTDGQGTIPEGEPVVALCEQLQSLGPLFGTTMVQNFDVFNTTLETAFAQQGLLLIDVHEAFLGHAFHYKDASHPHYHADDPTLWLQYDCIHPNQAGHDAIRRLIWRRLFGE